MAEDEGINASGSQGVQVGSGNTQHNYYRPLDHGFLSALSPHKALARLRGLPHDDAVSALASAPRRDVVEVLKADEALTVALLADLNPGKAEDLIGLLQTDWPWLAALPEAAEAIVRRAAKLKWDRDGNAGNLERVAATANSPEGYVREYASGLVYWNPPGAHELNGAFADAYVSSGGSDVLGLPS